MIRILLLVMALLLQPAAAGAQGGRGKPALQPEVPPLWLVEGHGARAYVFGTVHALPRGVDWFRPHVLAAFEQSTRLVLETDVPDSAGAMLPVLMKLTRLPQARPLHTRVPPDWQPVLARAVERLRPGPLDWSKTWFVALMLSNLQAEANGVDPRIGVEAVLTERARIKAIPVVSLETVEEQLINFDALTEADQQRILLSTLAELDQSKAQTSLLIGDWLSGDTEALAQRVNAEFEQTPMLRRMLVEDRNLRWADWIASQMKAEAKLPKGPMFIAVGAGHMAGKGSLLEDLEKQGLKVSRVVAEPAKRKRRR